MYTELRKLFSSTKIKTIKVDDRDDIFDDDGKPIKGNMDWAVDSSELDRTKEKLGAKEVKFVKNSAKGKPYGMTYKIKYK